MGGGRHAPAAAHVFDTLRLYGRETRWLGEIRAHGMTEAARANADATVGIRLDVIDDIVRAAGIARQRCESAKVIEAEEIADAPGDVVIRTCVIACDADPAYGSLSFGK